MDVMEPSLTCLPSPVAPSSTVSVQTSPYPLYVQSQQSKGSSYYRLHLHHFHETHPGCPTSLDCLPSTPEKPSQTLPVLVRAAILGSSQQRLTAHDIYVAIERRFPYFKTAKENWRGSIRHSLSSNDMFIQLPRPEVDPGFGAFWTVNMEVLLSKHTQKLPSFVSTSPSPIEVPESPIAGPSSPVQREDQLAPSTSTRGRKCEGPAPAPTRCMPARAASRKRSYADLLEPDEELLTKRPRGRPRKSDQPGTARLELPSEEAIIDTLIAKLAEVYRQHGVTAALSKRLADQLTDLQADNARARAGIRHVVDKTTQEQRKRKAAERKLRQLQMRITDLDGFRQTVESMDEQAQGTLGGEASYFVEGEGDVISQAMRDMPAVLSAEDFGFLIGES